MPGESTPTRCLVTAALTWRGEQGNLVPAGEVDVEGGTQRWGCMIGVPSCIRHRTGCVTRKVPAVQGP